MTVIEILSTDDRVEMFRRSLKKNESIPGKMHGNLDPAKNYLVVTFKTYAPMFRLNPSRVVVELIEERILKAKNLICMEYEDAWEHIYPMYAKEDELTLKELGRCLWIEALKQDKIKRGEV